MGGKKRSCPALVVVLMGFVLGCSGKDGTGQDGSDAGAGTGADANPGWMIAPPTAPEAPRGTAALPNLLPCPVGWREVTDAQGVVTCDPWPEAGTATCAGDTAAFAGDSGCTRVGTPCGAGNFAEGLPTDRPILYVRPGATGGDGSVDRPLGAINDAVNRAAPGHVIALAKGTYRETVILTNGATLWGACVAETKLTDATTDQYGLIVTVIGRGLGIRNLAIGAGARIGIMSERTGFAPRGQLHLQDVLIDGARSGGLVVVGDEVTADRLVVRDTRPRNDGRLGRGISIEAGASLQLSRSVIERNHEVGLFVHGRLTTARVEDTVVRDTLQGTSRLSGRGIEVAEEASLEAHHLVVERNLGIQVHVLGEGSTAVLEDAIIRDGRVAPDGAFAVNVTTGASAELRRALLERNAYLGLHATSPGSTLRAADIVVRATRDDGTAAAGWGYGLDVLNGAHAEIERAYFDENQGVAIAVDGRDGDTFARFTDITVRNTLPFSVVRSNGRGIAVEHGASAEITRALFDANHEIAVQVSEPGSTLLLEDATVRGTAHDQATLDLGRGIHVQSAAHATVRRTVFEENEECGISVAGTDAQLFAEDVIVRNGAGENGCGVHVQLGATASVSRALIENTRFQGVFLDGTDTAAHFEDLEVKNVDGHRSTGEHGRGLNVQAGAVATVRRGVLERSHEIGVAAIDVGTTVLLEDVIVRDARARACAPSCFPAGIGIGAYEQGRLEAHRFTVLRSQLCGVQVGRAGEMDLFEGFVTQNAIGGCIAGNDFDFGRLSHDVAYYDNGTNLDGTSVYVPESAPDLPGGPGD